MRRGVQRAVSVPTRSPNLRASLVTHTGSPRGDERPDLGGISARLSGAYRRSDPTIRSTAPRVSARRRTREASEASPQVRGSCSTRVRGETRRAVGRGGIIWGRVAVHGYSRGIPHRVCLKAARDDVRSDERELLRQVAEHDVGAGCGRPKTADPSSASQLDYASANQRRVRRQVRMQCTPRVPDARARFDGGGHTLADLLKRRGRNAARRRRRDDRCAHGRDHHDDRQHPGEDSVCRSARVVSGRLDKRNVR